MSTRNKNDKREKERKSRTLMRKGNNNDARRSAGKWEWNWDVRGYPWGGSTAHVVSRVAAACPSAVPQGVKMGIAGGYESW